MATLPLTKRRTCFSKHGQHQQKPFINLNNSWNGGTSNRHSLSSLLKIFSFYPTENSPYATSYLNSLIMVDPYAMKSQIPALSDWEEMKEEILTRCFWSHQVSHLVFLNENCTAPPRKCLEICVSHYWHLVGGARNAKHPAVTGPQNEELSPQKAITPSLTINVLNEGPPR